jgi:hypothetical protein
MRTFAILLAFLAVSTAAVAAATQDDPVVMRTPAIVATHPVDAIPTTDAPKSAAHVKLAAYVMEIMNSWPKASIPAADYASVAEDITSACLVNPSSDPHEDAVVLAALAYWEGARFASYVDECLCNDPGWREEGFDDSPHVRGKASFTAGHLMHIGGDCDGGRARSLWQIHADGIQLDGQPVLGADLCASREHAAWVALRLARKDPTLCSYSGEDPASGCPKAEQRVTFAKRALASHPFTP